MIGGLLVLCGRASSSSAGCELKDEEEKEDDPAGARLKGALWLVGSATGLLVAAGGGGQLLDQDTEAPPSPCFITSLVGGKGLEDVVAGGAGAGAGAGTGTGAGAGAEGGPGRGFGMFGRGAWAGAAGAGAGTAAAAAVPPLTDAGSAEDDFC